MFQICKVYQLHSGPRFLRDSQLSVLSSLQLSRSPRRAADIPGDRVDINDAVPPSKHHRRPPSLRLTEKLLRPEDMLMPPQPPRESVRDARIRPDETKLPFGSPVPSF